MRLGINAGYSGARIDLPMDVILEADRLGYYAVWTAEAYGSDAITPLAWIGALTKQIHLGTAGIGVVGSTGGGRLAWTSLRQTAGQDA